MSMMSLMTIQTVAANENCNVVDLLQVMNDWCRLVMIMEYDKWSW